MKGLLGPGQLDKGYQFIRREKAHDIMIRVAVLIQEKKTRSPFHLELAGKRLVLVAYAERNAMLMHMGRHFVVWIRNRIHLLAADSARIVKIQ